jgi:hypothetical protein
LSKALYASIIMEGIMQTYRAILKGNRLEWSDAEPTDLSPEQPVQVTILDTPDSTDPVDRGQRMAKALERLAATNALAQISDPVTWQREIRKDRPLPDREM